MSWIFSERFGVHTSFSARISPPELSRFSSQVMAQAARTPPPGILIKKMRQGNLKPQGISRHSAIKNVASKETRKVSVLTLEQT